MSKVPQQSTASQSKDKSQDKVEFDDLLRRMLSTPPKPRVKREKKKTGK